MRKAKNPFNALGAFGIKLRYQRMISAASSKYQSIGPAWFVADRDVLLVPGIIAESERAVVEP